MHIIYLKNKRKSFKKNKKSKLENQYPKILILKDLVYQYNHQC
jgi:hypothetical protein